MLEIHIVNSRLETLSGTREEIYELIKTNNTYFTPFIPHKLECLTNLLEIKNSTFDHFFYSNNILCGVSEEEFNKKKLPKYKKDIIGEGGFGKIIRFGKQSVVIKSMKVNSNPYIREISLNIHVNRVLDLLKERRCVSHILETFFYKNYIYLFFKFYREDTSGIINVFKDISLALYISEIAGITHNDIKPTNILYDGNNNILCDWGLAMWKDLIFSSYQHLQTCSHRAPEICKGENSSYKSDVFSLGIMVYEYYKDYSYSNDSNAEILNYYNQIFGENLNLDEIPKKFRLIVKKCLDFDPNKRPSYAQLSGKEQKDIHFKLSLYKKFPISTLDKSVLQYKKKLINWARDHTLSFEAILLGSCFFDSYFTENKLKNESFLFYKKYFAYMLSISTQLLDDENEVTPKFISKVFGLCVSHINVDISKICDYFKYDFCLLNPCLIIKNLYINSYEISKKRLLRFVYKDNRYDSYRIANWAIGGIDKEVEEYYETK